MRIALVSPLFESTPPRLYGGTERVVASICRGLVELGHDVTLFASGDSEALGSLDATVHEALRLKTTKVQEPGAYHLAQLASVVRRAAEFDVIHNHMDYWGFPLAHAVATPVVTTLHGRLDHPDTLHVLKAFKDIALVSISQAQRLPAPELNWRATVHHGLQMDHFAFAPEPGRYLAFLGRISPEKRPDLAIEIARQSDIPLKIAAKIDAVDRDYYEAKIKHLIDGHHIEYIGEISEREKSSFLGGALGMVFPIDWPEPFGLAPVEAWACGTPVLARPCGSVPELHRDGVTGYIRESAAELAALAPGLVDFDRLACRRYAERHFSYLRMAEDYVEIYHDLNGKRLPEDAIERAARARMRILPGMRHLGSAHSLGHLGQSGVLIGTER